MSIQSLMTPAMFIVRALVFPMSKNTARLSAKAHVALSVSMPQSNTSVESFIIAGYGELNFDTLGVTQQLSALLFEAVRLMLVQILITRQGMAMNPLQSLYYVSPACAFFLAFPLVYVEYPAMM